MHQLGGRNVDCWLALEKVLMFFRTQVDISVLDAGSYRNMHGFICRKTHVLVLFSGFHLQFFLQWNLTICLLLLCVRCSSVVVDSGSKVKRKE